LAESHSARDERRRNVRVRNDARVAAHVAWILRMETLESQLRTVALGRRNDALLARIGRRR